MILEPGRYEGVPVYTLLEAASRGYIGVDLRFLHAILDRPAEAIPDLVRFTSENHEDDPIDLEPQFIDIFRHLKTPEAIPFFVEAVRRNPLDVPDELVEGLAGLGASVVDPLLTLFHDLEGQDTGDLPFLLATLGVRDPRILEALLRGLERDTISAALHLEMYGDPAAIPALEAALAARPDHDQRLRGLVEGAIRILRLPPLPSIHAPESFDIWELYPGEDSPPFDALAEDERLAMLESSSATLRAQAAASYNNSELSPNVRARLLEVAKTDPGVAVRGAAWEALKEINDEPAVRDAMLAVLGDSTASVEEKGGAAIALAQLSDNAAVFQAIQTLYADPRGRAQALRAMAQSFDRRFAEYPPKHLDDPDPEIKRQSIWGIGYLNISSEASRLTALFEDDEYRGDALFAYALSTPGETSRGRVQSLMKKIEEISGGFREDEEELVKIALDQRLMLHGHKPVFFADDADDEVDSEPTVSVKVGRNDPCPCGSGKKYKKCCGT